MEKKILVIVDAQNDFIDCALGSSEAKACIPNICKRISDFKEGIIITTQDTHENNYLETPEGKNLPVEHCIRDTYGWGINVDVANSIISTANLNQGKIDYKYIYKSTFGSIELAEMINNIVRSTDEDVNIEICGFVSSICVISNALLIKTMLYDLNRATISVLKDCCAGLNDYNHESALEVMKSCQINII